MKRRWVGVCYEREDYLDDGIHPDDGARQKCGDVAWPGCFAGAFRRTRHGATGSRAHRFVLAVEGFIRERHPGASAYMGPRVDFA